MPRGVIVTYSRRHQLRQVKSEKDNSWGDIFEKKSKVDAVFGSSFSSGFDSSKHSDQFSSDFAETKPLKRYQKKANKENITSYKNGNGKKREQMFSLSDGTENTSSEMETSGNKPQPLQVRNQTSESAKKPNRGKGAKPANKKRKRMTTKANDQLAKDRERAHFLESSIEQERREVNTKSQFHEFEEFSLCIEDDKDDNLPTLKVPENLTPNSTSSSVATSAKPDMQRQPPQMHTSTPQMNRQPAESLFRRLTRSNLKKMSNPALVAPLSCPRYHISKSSTPGSANEASMAISPACSHISRRESLESERNFNDSLEYINISVSISHQINTRRRTKVTSQSSNTQRLSISSLHSPGFNVFTPISASGRPIAYIPELNESEIPDEIEKEEEEEEVYQDEASLEEMEAATDFACKLDEFHISMSDEAGDQENHGNKESEVFYSDSVFKDSTEDYVYIDDEQHETPVEDILKTTPVRDCDIVLERLSESLVSRLTNSAKSNRCTPTRDCDIVLERLSESLVSRITNSGKSINVKNMPSLYDASQSLFDEDISESSRKALHENSSVYVTAEETSEVEQFEDSQKQGTRYSFITDEIQSVSSCEWTSQDGHENSGNKSRPTLQPLGTIEEFNESCRSLQCLTPIRSRSSGHLFSPRTKVLMQCDQVDPITFVEFIPPAMMRKCVKIGEGVYGEVYRTQSRKTPIALKIIPVEGDFPVNDEPQKTFAEILPEIVISQNLSDLRTEGHNVAPNFVHLNRCGIIEGTYPQHLEREWDRFHEEKRSENDRPDMFPSTQLFLVLDFEESGSDLEGFKFTSLSEAKSVMQQVALSLAVAELELEFEHRDLHWGNILIKRTDEQVLCYNIDGEARTIETHSVKAAVIDFTLSRMKKDGVTAFTNLALDPVMFEGHGDYQFDVYRRMRDETGDNWEVFCPYTNILWLHYLADKLCNQKSYPKSGSRVHKSLNREFRTLMRQITDYNSATHLVSTCPFFLE